MIELSVATHRILDGDGYGRAITQFLEAMIASGDFNPHPYMIEQLGWSALLQQGAGIDHSRLTLAICPGGWMKPIPSRVWNLSMHESSQLPKGWADTVNETSERLLVPNEWCAAVFKESGVTIPVSIVPLGLDFNQLAILPQRKTRDRPYTFMCLADRDIRKGFDLVWLAFFRAFSKDDHVSLIIKARGYSQVPKMIRTTSVTNPMFSKIRLWVDDVPNVRDIYANADCYVYPARGDGFGFPPREAAACGLPVIVTDYSGTAGCGDWGIPLKTYALTPASGEREGLPGLWASPDVDELAHHMREAYIHQDDARQMGLQGAAWLRQNCTWEQSVTTLKTLLTEVDQTFQQRVRQFDAQDAAPPGGVSLQQLKQAAAAQQRELGWRIHSNGRPILQGEQS